MIVAVAGGKGGVGKTTVSLNLARELDAVVVDGDLATADLPHGRGPDLHDVLAGRAAPTAAVDDTGSVRVLPCGRTLSGARAADLSALAGAVDAIDRRYGRVVVDCPAGLAGDVGVELYAADVCVLVTTAAEPALADAARTRRLALDVDAPIAAVALNGTERDPDRVERVERSLGAPVVAIPDRPEIHDARAAGEPLRDVHPDCDAVESLETLAEIVADSERPERGRHRAR